MVFDFQGLCDTVGSGETDFVYQRYHDVINTHLKEKVAPENRPGPKTKFHLPTPVFQVLC